MSDFMDLRKDLFNAGTGTGRGECSGSETHSMNDALSKKLQIEHETDEEYKKSEKEAHEKRMKKFRRYAKQIEENDWVYPPMEKLIGLK